MNLCFLVILLYCRNECLLLQKMASLKLLRVNTSWDLQLQGAADQSPVRHSLGVCLNNRGIHR